MSREVNEQVGDVKRRAAKAAGDPRIVALLRSRKLRSLGPHFFEDIGDEGNLIIDGLGQVRAVDW